MRTALKMAAMAAATPNYYFDQTGGNDSNNGLTLATAFKTIAKFNTLTANPSYIRKFKCGETWREQALVPASGITMGNYGTGVLPRILGSNAVTGAWTNEASTPPTPTKVQGPYYGIGTAPMVATFGAGPTQGNLLIAWVTCTGSTAGITSAAITGWVCASSAIEGTGNGFASVWYKVAGAGEGTTVSLTIAGQTGMNLAIEEWTGLTNPILDKIAKVDDTGGTVTSRSSGTTATTTAATELCIACVATGSTITSRSWSNSFVAEVGSDIITIFASALAVSTTGTQETTLSWTTARRAGGCIATFKGDATPANTWSNALAAAPVSSLWFVNASDGAINWGNLKTSVATLAAEFDYFWDATPKLYVYAATTPATRYTSIETSVRYFCIYTAVGTDGVTINGIETAYCNTAAITIRNNSTVQYCHPHHIGDRVSGGTYNALAAGVSILNGSNCVVSHNTVNDAGRRGISMMNLSSGGTCNNELIELNTVYDCYHSCIDIEPQTTATMIGYIIRNNLVYWTAGMSMTPGSSVYAGISFGGEANTCYADSIQVYNNILKNLPFTGIDGHDYCSNILIHHNTIYGTHPSTTGQGIGIRNGGAHQIGTNIIRDNICQDATTICFQIVDHTKITTADYNAWYQSLGLSHDYTMIDGNPYHYNDQATYKSDTGYDAHGVWADPLFTDAANGVFTLQAGSPCKNTASDGTNMGAL